MPKAPRPTLTWPLASPLVALTERASGARSSLLSA
jgi:hypothetical protein